MEQLFVLVVAYISHSDVVEIEQKAIIETVEVCNDYRDEIVEMWAKEAPGKVIGGTIKASCLPVSVFYDGEIIPITTGMFHLP